MEKKIIELLCENARLSASELAERCGASEAEVTTAIKSLEKQGIICGYTAILDDRALGETRVKALIEVKVTPKREGGFDEVARRIAKYPEVVDVMLISGGFDLLLTIEGTSLAKVANFVSEKLATIDGVLSTSTGFILKKYKEAGRMMQKDEEYERLKICF